MGVSRRTFLGTAAGGSAAAGLAALGMAGSATAATAAPAASGPGDVVGKVTVGYQGWFACIGDGAPINAWWHYSANGSQPPSPSNTTIVAWPDVRDYTRTYQTAYANLGNGQPATLFSSYDQQTVDTHFLWLQQNNIDTAALQRFNPNGSEGPTRDAMAAKVRSSAETHGRKFYIMYDVSDWTNMQSEIKTDWTSKMKAHTASSAYATQNGKPVVCIWGFGFADNQRPFDAASCLDVVNWFKDQGCYVIGGVPTWWRTGDRDSRPGFSDVYHAFHMLSPWMVGRIGNVADADNFYNVATVPDLAECATYGIDYQPCVLPGAVLLRQRAHGDFMWRQFYNMKRAGVASVYISMFDEFNEGNQIAKTAETQAWVPTNSGFLALDEDGTACSSDYYLRLTGDGGKMLKGQIALTATRPTPPVVGGGGDTVPPTAPGNLQVTAHTSTSVTLAWTAATDNVGVTGYRVLSVTGSATSPVGSTAGNVTGFTVTGLTPSTAYTFDVQALDAAGDISQPSNQVTVTTDAGSTPTGNLALAKVISASSQTQVYYPSNANDGNANTYWESANNAFPQWLQVDLGSVPSQVKRLVLKLPPATAWATRTQTISVQTGASLPLTTQLAALNYTFNPATGNAVTITLPAAVTARYVRLNFTANTGWPAGQLSELEVYSA
ncbi:Fibronectin type III domain-containing protein [Streptomyces sp. DvalAA-14]|uniref:galactose-binding domain-containing protein n=1 Tax=unclassified Streptomyces TaxID=2593676 RepID=UPI00081BA3A0|nr:MULTISPECIES: discoidin domain-containing protein [unclassified Streptomyces]MYS19548.1 xylosidase [Streptomyces sp. SID4948]SCD47143.1 Fibronectin type III domain-containing protein [Streptomyces sp. DvalAA-14]